jgi:hypothetical protein
MGVVAEAVGVAGGFGSEMDTGPAGFDGQLLPFKVTTMFE